MGGLLKALVGVPSWLFTATGERGRLIPTQEIRLSGLSHIPIHSLISPLLASSQHWLTLQSLLNHLRTTSTDLVQLSFAEAIDGFLRFYQGLILAMDEGQSVLQLEYGTARSRRQLELLALVAEGIETDKLTGEYLLNYLKVAAIAYDGDVDQSDLLRSLLKETSLSFCHFLHLSLYFGEFLPGVSHFFLQYDPTVTQEKDLDVRSFEGMVRLKEGAGEGFIGEMYEKVRVCVRNVMLLRLLPTSLGNYYLAATGGVISPPSLLLRLTDIDLKAYSETLTAFSTAQMELLIEIDRLWLLEGEKKREIMEMHRELRLNAIREDQKMRQEAETALKVAKIQQKSVFFTSLTEQIRLKREILRTEEERQRLKDEEEERKIKEEHDALIARGKEILEKQFGEIMKDVEYRQRLLDWKKRRMALRNERNQAILMPIEGEFVRGKRGRKTWEEPVDPGDVMLVEEQEEGKEEEVGRQEQARKRWERQPPGGVSTVGELMKDAGQGEKEERQGRPRMQVEVKRGDRDAPVICSDILWDNIIARVLRQVTPRKKWQQVVVANPLKAMLEELGLSSDPSAASILPLPLLLEKSFITPITLQCDLVDKLCVHLFLKRLDLLNHLKAIKRYALMSAGDTMELFATSLFSIDFTGDVQSAFEGAIKISSCKDDPYAAHCAIEDTRVTWFGIRYNLHSLSEVSYLRFRYQAGWPLNVVLSPNAMDRYTTIFVTLLRLRFVSRLLGDIKTRLHTSWIRRQTGPIAARFRTALLLRQKMHHIVMILQEYIVTEVHFSAWKQLEKALNKASSLDEVISAHESYLGYIMKRCFLQDNGKVVMDNANIIFELVTRFITLLNSEPPNEPLSSSAYEDMKRIEGDFDSVHRFMYNMTKTVVATKGLYTELFLRLDFNNYLARVSR